MSKEVVVSKELGFILPSEVAKKLPPAIWGRSFGARYIKWDGRMFYVWYGDLGLAVFNYDGEPYSEVTIMANATGPLTIADIEKDVRLLQSAHASQ